MLVNVVHVKCILKSALSALDTFWNSVGSCTFQCAMRVQNTKIEVCFCEQRRWMRVAKTKRKMANEKWKIYFILNCLVCNNSNILFIVSYRLSLCHFWNIVFYWADVQNLWIGSRRVVRVHCDRSNERTFVVIVWPSYSFQISFSLRWYFVDVVAHTLNIYFSEHCTMVNGCSCDKHIVVHLSAIFSSWLFRSVETHQKVIFISIQCLVSHKAKCVLNKRSWFCLPFCFEFSHFQLMFLWSQTRNVENRMRTRNMFSQIQFEYLKKKDKANGWTQRMTKWEKTKSFGKLKMTLGERIWWIYFIQAFHHSFDTLPTWIFIWLFRFTSRPSLVNSFLLTR